MKIFNEFSNSEKKNVLLLVFGQFTTMFGTQLFAFALSFYILKITGSTIAFSISLLINFLPKVLLSNFSGRLADKYSKKKIVVLSDLFSGIFLLSILLFNVSFDSNVRMIYFTQLILTAINSFYTVALRSAIPEIVSTKNVTKTNSINNTISSLSRIFGPMLGGIIILNVQMEMFWVINGITFLLSGIVEMFLSFESKGSTSQKTNNTHTKDKQAVIVQIQNDKSLKFVLIYSLILNFLLYFGFIVPVPHLVINELKMESFNYGIIQGSMSIGAFLTGLVLSSIKLKVSEIKILLLSSLIMSISIAGIGLITMLQFLNLTFIFILMVTFSIIVGSMIIISSTFSISIIQKNTNNAILGRIFGYLGTATNFIVPIAILSSGALLKYLNSSYFIMIVGVISVILNIILYKSLLKRKKRFIGISFTNGEDNYESILDINNEAVQK